MARAARLREIENLLFRNPQGMRVIEIADACGVDRRTIYRDIDLLSEAGVPIWQEDGQYGVIREQYLATVRLRLHEAVALYIAARLLSRHADEHNPHIVSALTKLSTAFPQPLADYITRTAEAIEHRPVNETFLAVLQEIALCWAEGRKVRIWYRSPGSHVRERDVSPYTLEPSGIGGLYLIGYEERVGEMRTFKLDRIERAEGLGEAYTIPADFDPRTYLASAWGIMAGGEEPHEILLHFSAAAAVFIRERIWHPSQRLEPQPDGSMYMWLAIGDEREIRPWIRSWGAEVEVIAPSSLREDIAGEVKRMQELYNKTDEK
ncbi:MAG: WYL domain-containing protein [Anaerolineae bacterium]